MISKTQMRIVKYDTEDFQKQKNINKHNVNDNEYKLIPNQSCRKNRPNNIIVQ